MKRLLKLQLIDNVTNNYTLDQIRRYSDDTKQNK